MDQETVGTRLSAFRVSSMCYEAITHNGTIFWCGQVLKDGSYCYIVWEESNPVSVSCIPSKCLQGQMNGLFLNARQDLAGEGVRPLAAGRF